MELCWYETLSRFGEIFGKSMNQLPKYQQMACPVLRRLGRVFADMAGHPQGNPVFPNFLWIHRPSGGIYSHNETVYHH